MQSMINSIAEVFEERIKENRGDKIRDWGEILSAKPFLGTQAVKLGLIDNTGSLYDAIRTARRLAGLPETAPVKWVKPRKPTLLVLGGGESKAMKLSYEILLMWPLPTGIDPTQLIVAEAR